MGVSTPFKQGLSGPEEMEIPKHITRVLLERVVGFYQHGTGAGYK